MIGKLPFDEEVLHQLSKNNSTFHLYNQKGILNTCKYLNSSFKDHGINYQNFFAVKANYNPEILKLVLSEGMGLDCSSMGELILAQKLNLKGDIIMFTSNNTKDYEFKKAYELEARITFDDITYIPFYEKIIKNESLEPWRSNQIFACRYNPGDSLNSNFSNSNIIGNPKEAKFGMTREQIFEAYKMLKDRGVRRFGIHSMIASNELRWNVIVEIFKHMLELTKEIMKKVDIEFEYINFGGGLGIPYNPNQSPIDLEKISKSIKILLDESKLKCQVIQENGRFIVGSHGYLITKVTHIKKTYKNYLCLDANMCDLMRPALYGAYHHIQILNRNNKTILWDVVGSLCENNDKFAIDRELPFDIEIGDLVIIYCTGAHGYSMGNNYNGKLKHAEYLIQDENQVKMIRRAETFEDLYATLNF